MKHMALLAAAVLFAACNNEITGLGPPSDPATETFAPSLNIDLSQMEQLPNGVYIEDILVGGGDSVTDRTDTLWVTYTGWLVNGNEFDRGTNTAFEPDFVVEGFRTGLHGLRVGGRRRIVIPSALGYGPNTIRRPDGRILVPRQSTLVFQVELLRVKNPVEDDDEVTQ